MSKEAIINAIRKNKPESRTRPDEPGSIPEKTITGLKDRFLENLRRAGADVIELNGEDEMAGYMKTRRDDTVDFDDPVIFEAYASNYPKSMLAKMGNPLLKGQFGVAENGAIWLDESNFPNRLIPFIARQLIIKLEKGDLVRDMHEAYRKVNLKEPGFGVFISGPSKTADIEQSLVYGAHGAEKLCVILY